MAHRKEKTITQLGKQPPCYRFFLNPYQDERFTKCPQCESKMHQRKLPLMIHVEPMEMLSLNMTCRSCPHCDLLIAHQDHLEHFLASFFTEQKPEVMGNDYLVIGTLEKTAWRRGMQEPLSVQEMLEALHDFKEEVSFEMRRGWMKEGT